ncbi:gluconokinase [Halomonas campisalis]|uniref:Gluconokinase n=1 Tax=Billgrantia campisalis TaxID=74661 RepID=A0ABS9P856_9GAMM|nr:gluconokinase [Halomonas campisalis]MCG6657962.1 gluconokinase [Halomonas campisalis]MDR5863513.1 gluconokinase [Halomonas campisalis]
MSDATYRILVMGVSGSGKSHVGRLLAKRLEADFIDGDDHHSPASIAKMANGTPLDDGDRQDWLQTLAGFFGDYRRHDASLVIACSALKGRYRELLRNADPALRILYLHGERTLLRQRLMARPEHFFKGDEMLDSQLADLEPPSEGEALALSVSRSPQCIVEACMDWLRMP